jgi:hypothetical protein
MVRGVRAGVLQAVELALLLEYAFGKRWYVRSEKGVGVPIIGSIQATGKRVWD